MTFSCHIVKRYIFLPLINQLFPPLLVSPGSIYCKCTAKKSILRSYASSQSDQSSSLTLCIVTKFGTTSTTTDQNAQMHNTLSDLFTLRLSCEQTEMKLKNYGKENNHGSDFCMKDSVRFYNENSSENFDQSEHLYRLSRVSATRRNNGCFATDDSLPVRRLIKVFSSQMP